MAEEKTPGDPAQNEMRTIYNGIHVTGALGNDVSIETDSGVIQVDTGLYPSMAHNILDQLRTRTDAPIHTIVYTHGHSGHNGGAATFLKVAEERGEPRPQIVAHERLVARYRRYEKTWEHQNRMAAIQFRLPTNMAVMQSEYTYPDITFKKRLSLNMGNRIVEVLHAPSETDDCVAIWLPEEKVLYGGPALIMACPNTGTPFRMQRDSVRWADTLEGFLALGPEFLIPPSGEPIDDPEMIRQILSTTVEALRYLYREVIERVNKGMTDVEILHDITYPPALFDLPWMGPSYGCPDFIVRDIYRSENGWWDRNPTSLHPASPEAVGEVIVAAIGDKKPILEKVLSLKEAGDIQLALHVVDLLALAPGDDPDVVKARLLKAELCHLRSKDVPSFVSRNLYLSTADQLEEQNKTPT